jgi:predicted acylesterase/phospholipase RssA
VCTTAFVITGGASLGAVHVGMLKALYETGIAPQLIVGTSVGATCGWHGRVWKPSSDRATSLTVRPERSPKRR